METEDRNFNWETLTYVYNKFDEFGKTQAIQIRWAKVHGGRRTFSYVIGVLSKNGEGEPVWSPYKYIPDRFVTQYINLLMQSCEIVREALKLAEKELQNSLTVSMEEMIKSKHP